MVHFKLNEMPDNFYNILKEESLTESAGPCFCEINWQWFFKDFFVTLMTGKVCCIGALMALVCDFLDKNFSTVISNTTDPN